MALLARMVRYLGRWKDRSPCMYACSVTSVGVTVSTHAMDADMLLYMAVLAKIVSISIPSHSTCRVALRAPAIGKCGDLARDSR